MRRRNNLPLHDLIQGPLMLTPNYNAVIRQDGEWWIGRIEEVPGVNSQRATRGKAKGEGGNSVRHSACTDASPPSPFCRLPVFVRRRE